MRCTLYSDDGALLSEGTCEPRDGGYEMVALRWHLSPRKGAPLTLFLENGERREVTVEEIHVASNDGGGPREVYQLRALEPASGKPEKRGFLASLFGR